MKSKRWATALLAGLCLLALGACGQATSHKAAKSTISQSSKKTKKKVVKQSHSSSTRSTTSSSSSADTIKPATLQEKLAMVLQAPGAENFASATSQSVSQTSDIVTDTPNGTVVYSLSVQHDDKTPMIVLVGNEGYLFNTQSSGIPFTWVQQNALQVDLSSTWTRDHGKTGLEQLAQQLSIVSADQQTQSTDPTNIDAVFRQYESEATEDSSTVSGDGPQTSSFNQLDGDDTWWWTATKADGTTAYHMSLGDIEYVGNNTYTAQASQTSPMLDAVLTITFSSPNQYRIQSTDINYDGMFNY
jgi:hypothetical protein